MSVEELLDKNNFVVVKARLKKIKVKDKVYVYARIPQLPKEFAGKELVIIPREELEILCQKICAKNLSNSLTQTFDAKNLTQNVSNNNSQTIDAKLVVELSKAIVSYLKKREETRNFLRRISLI